ncbi:ribonuclease P protein component 4 [Methanolobus psychrotolerans]|uniref:ribonuclease P protein component 4 n=1 Tax=Methanolobus psychrotolerans TaxID=1874706 RepID=UPI000B918BEA|nr:ribonuclease P protein component 4 [Methanolobus psychrotolerans]
MAKFRTKNKAISKTIAQERIQYLFEIAKNELSNDSGRSERYISLARKIGMRHRVSIPAELKRNLCKKCGSLLVPGKNSRTRLKDSYVIITCLECGEVKRYPFNKVSKVK